MRALHVFYENPYTEKVWIGKQQFYIIHKGLHRILYIVYMYILFIPLQYHYTSLYFTLDISRSPFSKKSPHSSPVRAMYGVSFVSS